MAIQNNFPAIKPTLLLDFAKVKLLDPRITFTRASTGTFYNSAGVLSTAASGVARFDFNPTTDESLGLLIEEQRTNLLTYSDLSLNSFTDGVTVTANSIASPDGTVNATLLTSTVTGGSNTCYADRGATATTSTTYSYSIFLKAGTSPISTINLYFVGGSFRQAVGTVTWATLAYSVTSTDSTATGTITNVGNGWYRLTLTYDSGNNTNLVSRVYVRSQGSSNVAGETVYAWGRQTEAGAFPTSYIQTVASQVTRAADSASMTGTNFSSWYNQGEGTLYGEYIGVANISGATRRLAEIGIAATITNRFVFGYSEINNTRFLTVAGGVGQADISVSATQGSATKFAGTYATNNFQQSTNRLLGFSDTDGIIPLGINAMAIGSDFGPTANTALNGTIRKIAYYPIRCTNAQLVALTS